MGGAPHDPGAGGPGFDVPLPKDWSDVVRRTVLHAIGLAHVALVFTRSFAADSRLDRVRLAGRLNAAQQENALLREELRLVHARMARVEPRRRPHYPPCERLAILSLRAARAWSLAQTALHLLVDGKTIAAWMGRLDEKGEEGLVRTPVPVNRFDDLVGLMVHRLKALCPSMGTKRIAQTLARAGLHLGRSTVRRMQRRTMATPCDPDPAPTPSKRPLPPSL